MFTRILIVLLLVASAITTTATADPGTTWTQTDPPSFALVADFSRDIGLEAIYWDGLAGELHGVSLADFHDLGMLPGQSNPNETFLSAIDLDEDGYAEVVKYVGPNSERSHVTAYKHNGTSWSEMWRSDNQLNEHNTDLQLVDLNGDRRGSYLMVSGGSMQLCDPTNGLVVWSSEDPGQGTGPRTLFVNWTMANFDQDPGNTEELMAEFIDEFGHHHLLMINEVVAAATPLQSTIISLGASRPNPMFGATTVQFELPESTLVRLNIYDVRGRRVATLANRTMAAGSHALRWNGNDKDGSRVAQGVYFYELKAAGQTRTRKMMVVR